MAYIIPLVHIDHSAGLLRDRVHCPHMVIMTVGQQYRAAFQAVHLQVIQNRIGFIARINDGAVERVFIRYDIAVGFELSHGDGFNEHDS